MAKPTIYKITPFDANVGTEIKFSWSGRQQERNQAIITDASGTEIYWTTLESFKGIHGISGDSVLENGKIYSIKIRIQDMDGNWSEFSDPPTSFRCFTTPNISFDGFDSSKENKITNSSISLTLNYTQAENEELNTWRAFLYNHDKSTIVQQTNELYASSTTYTYFSGLDDTSTYYVRAIGTTVNGMNVDTGFVEILTSYLLPGKFINLDVNNNKKDGTIHIASYAVSLTGKTKDDEEIEFENDASGNPYAAKLDNSFVVFDEDVLINKDFTLYYRAKNIRVIDKTDYDKIFKYDSTKFEDNVSSKIFESNIDISSVSNYSDVIDLILHNAFLVLTDTDTGKRYYFTLWKTESDYQVFLYCNDYPGTYSVWSNSFSEPQNDQFVNMAVQRKNGVFAIKVVVK